MYEMGWWLCSLRKEYICNILGEKGAEDSEDKKAISDEGNQEYV